MGLMKFTGYTFASIAIIYMLVPPVREWDRVTSDVDPFQLFAFWAFGMIMVGIATAVDEVKTHIDRVNQR